LGLHREKATIPPDLEEMVKQAQAGNNQSREALLKNYTPFVLAVAAKVGGRYVRLGEDDEAGIGLMAFNEAVDSFRFDRGVSFLPFAEMVIRRRLVDYYRRQKHRAREIPLSEFEDTDDEGHVTSPLPARQAQEVYGQEMEAWERKQEVAGYREALAEYGISLAELVRVSPRHEDARRRAMEVARLVAADPRYREHLQTHKTLPIRELELQCRLSRKTLERQRKYIIAVAIIYLGEYHFLQEYLKK